MAKKQTASGGRSTSSGSKSTPKKRATSSESKTKKTTPASRTASKKASKSQAAGTKAQNQNTRSRGTSKSTTKSKPRTRVTKKRPTISKRPDTLQRLRERLRAAVTTATDPAFWRGLVAKLPPWIDEVGALLLIVLGVVMLTALLNTSSQGTFAVTTSDILRQLFGNGAYIFSIGVLGTGIILLLPKFGLVLRLGWVRIAAIEITFGSLLALLHLFANDPQPRALAQEGGGGGYIGWALTEVISSLGRVLSLGFYGLVFLAGLALIFQLRPYHIVIAGVWLRTQLERSINRLDTIEPGYDWDEQYDEDEHEESTHNPAPPNTTASPAASTGRPSVVPRAASPETPASAPAQAKSAPQSEKPASRPPRSKPTAADAETNAAPAKPRAPRQSARTLSRQTKDDDGDNAAEMQTGEDTDKDTASTPPAAGSKNGTGKNDAKKRERPLTAQEKKEIAERARQTIGAENGRSLIAPGEPGERESVVPREFLPDARVVPAAPRARIRRQADMPASERYFTVEDFRETKKIGKRDNNLPPLALLSDVELDKPTEEEINTNAKIIRNTLEEFEVDVEVIDVHVGPTVTQYAVSPYTEYINEDGERTLKRVRVSEITNLGGDLALALSARRLRIQAPVPGHSYVGIEVPNRKPSTVALRPVLESEHFYKYRKRPLALPLGRDVSGEPFIADLGTMPHLLIAGTTGSGKSIMLAAMTTAFVMNNTPDRLRLVLLDPKMVELSRFNGLPHLLGPVETELDRIIGVLRWATREMERRYKLLEKEAARNIDTYNEGLGRRRKDERLPYLVIMIDEIGDLMMQRPDETEHAITRLAQMARAVGIHLMVATQRPSVDVITGLIKANFPARISFAVASSVDSRVILDSNGAETLMGRGDMLFLAPDAAGPRRIQGCFVSDEEVNDVVDYWQEWQENQTDEENEHLLTAAPWERGMTRREVLSETDPMLEDAIELVVKEGEASASLIQRKLGLGYPRAARIVDMMHELGIVGAARPGGRSREVLVKPGADPFKAIVEKRMRTKSKKRSSD